MSHRLVEDHVCSSYRLRMENNVVREKKKKMKNKNRITKTHQKQ